MSLASVGIHGREKGPMCLTQGTENPSRRVVRVHELVHLEHTTPRENARKWREEEAYKH